MPDGLSISVAPVFLKELYAPFWQLPCPGLAVVWPLDFGLHLTRRPEGHWAEHQNHFYQFGASRFLAFHGSINSPKAPSGSGTWLALTPLPGRHKGGKGRAVWARVSSAPTFTFDGSIVTPIKVNWGTSELTREPSTPRPRGIWPPRLVPQCLQRALSGAVPKSQPVLDLSSFRWRGGSKDCTD